MSTDPLRSWITQETEAISASPLPFAHDPEPVPEFANPAAKRQKLNATLDSQYPSRYSITQEKSSDLSRQCSRQLPQPDLGGKTSPARLGPHSSLLDERHRLIVLHPSRPSFTGPSRNEQKRPSNKGTLPTTRENHPNAFMACAASQCSSNGIYHLDI